MQMGLCVIVLTVLGSLLLIWLPCHRVNGAALALCIVLYLGETSFIQLVGPPACCCTFWELLHIHYSVFLMSTFRLHRLLSVGGSIWMVQAVCLNNVVTFMPYVLRKFIKYWSGNMVETSIITFLQFLNVFWYDNCMQVGISVQGNVLLHGSKCSLLFPCLKIPQLL